MHFTNPGNNVTLTAPSGGVIAGTAYLITNLLVVAAISAAEGESFEGSTNGVYEDAPKATGQTWAEGAKPYLRHSLKKFRQAATSNTLCACALAAAASGDTTGTVFLTGVVR